MHTKNDAGLSAIFNHLDYNDEAIDLHDVIDYKSLFSSVYALGAAQIAGVGQRLLNRYPLRFL